MTQRESRLSRSILKKLAEQPETFAWKNHGSEFTVAGLPDIIVCHKGRFIGLEVKNPESRANVSAAQKLIHTKIANARGRVYVVCSIAEALQCVLLNPELPGAIE